MSLKATLLNQSLDWRYGFAMQFHPSKTHDRLNEKPFDPQMITRSVMLNPKYPAYNIVGALDVDIDSGAFQELKNRKPLGVALKRQILFKRRLDLSNVQRCVCFTYDQMKGVDEQIINGRKVKLRGTKESATPAIAATLHAARYWNANRAAINGPIGFVCQGINPDQYINDCALPMLELFQDGDVFGFGGFCIIGRVPSLKPVFVETFSRMMEILYQKGVEYAHIMGVCVADMIGWATLEAAKYGIKVSTDSSSPEFNAAAFGKRFINESWIPVYNQDQKFFDYHPCDLALQNIKDYYQWITDIYDASRLECLLEPSLPLTLPLHTLELSQSVLV